jgi:hypothetical protein
MICMVHAVPKYWTVLTSMFMHGGWFHLIGNMLFLWVFGNNIEDVTGHGRFLVFYLLCGVAAAAAQTFISPHSVVPMVGASGAISGVLGAYLLLYPKVRVHTLIILPIYITTVALPAWVMLGYWMLLQVVRASPSQPGRARRGRVLCPRRRVRHWARAREAVCLGGRVAPPANAAGAVLPVPDRLSFLSFGVVLDRLPLHQKYHVLRNVRRQIRHPLEVSAHEE